MKQTFLLFICALFTNSLFAQHVVYSEDFDSYALGYALGWTQVSVGGTPWQVNVPEQVAQNMGGAMGRYFNFSQVLGLCDSSIRQPNVIINNNNLIYSPSINLTGIVSPWLSYDTYFIKKARGSDTEKATIEISTDTGRTWTVVQNLPANPDENFTTYFINLSAYANAASIHIGFRYKDGGHGNMAGWGLDNIKVFEPAHKDMRMANVIDDSLLDYGIIGQNTYHRCRVQNYGLDTINSFTISYNQSGHAVAGDVITGVSIPPFGYYSTGFSAPDTVTAQGKHLVTMTVRTTGDTIHSNDTGYTYIYGAYFIPKKRLMIEEGTSTLDYWGPRGWVYMNQISVPSDSLDVCIASVHDNDPMAVQDYADYMINCNFYAPCFIIDRKSNVGYDTLFATLQKYKQHFGYADVAVDGGVNGSSLTVNTHITPAIDLNGDYRLVLVITEDTVTGTSSAYSQNNNFAGGKNGLMGGFENKPNPVPASDMYYNFVARQANPGPEGTQGLLPMSMTHGVTYDYSYNVLLDHSWNPNHLKAVVMLINHDDSAVLNANKFYNYVKTEQTTLSVIHPALYPNPARDVSRLQFTANGTEKLTVSVVDISGRTVFQLPDYNSYPGANEIVIPTHNLSNGIYMVTVNGDNCNQTLKLDVIN